MEIDEQLILWYLQHGRDLPWRNTRNPYHIWLSEIILQQTRVDQGMAYYLKFIETFPNVKVLAKADEDTVLKMWQGLGYYSRARNLHASAKYIANELNGEFPNTYKDILKLKGVGPYTAAAISSFAFKLPHAVVDGNVSRVLSRLFDISTPINSSEGQKEIQQIADECLSRSQPDIYNQAIMELGATVCKPTNPDCENCPLAYKCLSRLRNTIAERPVKIKAKKAVIRHIDYAVLESENEFILKKRTGKDIWQGLHDFTSIEGMEEPVEKYLTAHVKENFPNITLKSLPAQPAKQYTHLLSHQRIIARFWNYKFSGILDEKSVYFSVAKQGIDAIAVPRLIHRYLEDIDLV